MEKLRHGIIGFKGGLVLPPPFDDFMLLLRRPERLKERRTKLVKLPKLPDDLCGGGCCWFSNISWFNSSLKFGMGVFNNLQFFFRCCFDSFEVLFSITQLVNVLNRYSFIFKFFFFLICKQLKILFNQYFLGPIRY